MKLPYPFNPVEIDGGLLTHTVSVLGRSVTFGADSMPGSIVSAGRDLLSAPVRLVGIEDGEPIIWDGNYPENESECYIQSRSDEKAVLCGAMRSERFVVDTCISVEYDGAIRFDLKIMPRGDTVNEVFGIEKRRQRLYKLERLWLEIPLDASAAQMYSIYPNSDIKLNDGTVIANSETTSSGFIPACDAALPFKPLMWLGNDDLGLGFFADSDRNWQPESSERALELIHDGGALILRLRLLDSQPAAWSGDMAAGKYLYNPIGFSFGLQATPVKEFPRSPYAQNAFHLDCFVKTKGNYIDFLSEGNRFDRLKEKGVTTLILHEKWNKSQNCFELSEFTAEQLRRIVSECHRRGIKVLTYFGYEISSLAPMYSEFFDEVKNKLPDGHAAGGWYRVPYQRDYVVCYGSRWSERFVEGICKIIDEFNTDGVYLDGTTMPRLCANTSHGCGYYTPDGTLHGTYPVEMIRLMFRRLYTELSSRGCMINVHSFGCLNFTVLPYIHGTWYGENLQFAYIKGSTADMPLDYFRAEYTGRNMGVPVEFIAYENRPVWNFENAVALSVIHGILPRPNDIGHPLDLMSGIWRAIGDFPVAQSEWLPYWKNNVYVSDKRVKVSYYKYKAPDGSAQFLVFCANTTAAPLDGVELSLGEEISRAIDINDGGDASGALNFGAYDYKIIYMR